MNINNNLLRTVLVPVLFSAACFTSTLSASAADADPKATFLDGTKAGIDFELQGEYSGEISNKEGKVKVGGQVIALGSGKFQLVGYRGGLPGDGWDRSDKLLAEGEVKDGSVTFNGNNLTVVVRKGELSVSNKEGKDLGTIAKVLRESPTAGKKPPEGAIVLFDGKSADNFEKGQLTEDGLLKMGITSKKKFQDCQVHVEFRTPFMPNARGQARGNSGCYLQGRYEVQILDSFGLEGKDNECGGLYETRDPSVNMCFPPLSWQTYDIDFTAARYDAAGKKVKNALITVRHNGVIVQENVELPKATRAAPNAEGAEPGPLYFQDHGNPVYFRNIWVVEKKG